MPRHLTIPIAWLWYTALPMESVRPPAESLARSTPALAAFEAPYPPSWFDRYSAWFDRRPAPFWIYHLALSLAGVLVVSWAHWAALAYPVGHFDPLHLAIGATAPLILILMHFLTTQASRALDTFRPALSASTDKAEELRYRLTTLPARGTALSGLAFMVGAPLFTLGIQAGTAPLPSLAYWRALPFDVLRVSHSPVPAIIALLELVLTWWVLGAFIYMMAHQLRTIDAIYSRFTRVNILHLSPLHAFSRHTARMAIITILLGSGTFLFAPELISSPGTIASVALISMFGAAVFILPLSGIHDLLNRTKDEALQENAALLQIVLERIHAALRGSSLREMEELEKSLASLEAEHALLARIPTWPWQPGTARGVTAAVLLPLIVWILQQVLAPFVAP